MANCIKCGAELMPGAVYCHACGKNRWLKREKAGHDQTVQEMPTKRKDMDSPCSWIFLHSAGSGR